MHEFFLAGVVKPADFSTACAILQGLAGGAAVHEIHRVVFYQGLSQPKGFKPPREAGAWQPAYAELGKVTQRQGFIVRARWDVSNTAAAFGPDTKPVDLNAVPGTLHWVDIPDPTQSPVFQRKMLEISGQLNLAKTLAVNEYM